ncbi:MAG: hypothetical protein HY298_21670 [Verrucomicrobia bacterium]|nr:hypothetical protein [Verrucomicrobiota bacterium]
MRSELVMLGDFNSDKRWDQQDRELMQSLLANPFQRSAKDCIRADLNNDGRLDAEDLAILEQLTATGDPYETEAKAVDAGKPFPRPRELYRYVSPQDYVNRPLFALPYAGAKQSPLDSLSHPKPPAADSPYARQLAEETYNEAVRFDLAYHARLPQLTETEQTYCRGKIEDCNQFYAAGMGYDLLLELIGLVEDAETLTTRGQDEFISKTLFFRDHLRELLDSPQYSKFEAGRVTAPEILKTIERYLKQDLGLEVTLEKLGPPRDLTHLKNYLSRTQWQYYKSRTRVEQFEQLIHFAQHDRRYLRAVCQTTPKHGDPGVENHNLPMILLFREAVRITGDKRAAVGLVDETIRIPFFWVKSIPRDKLPGSVAQENFLLPGNKEDGSDKSRHWNVFGGICLYKSPQESLDLALKRESQDLREGHYSPDAMTEFIRDTIANLNGIYYVVSMNPDLLRPATNAMPAADKR